MKMSYMVGYGNNYPTQLHHRGASIDPVYNHSAKVGCSDGYTSYFSSSKPNPNIHVGAIVGGPTSNDGFSDIRSDHSHLEPTTYKNAAIVGSVAAFLYENFGQPDQFSTTKVLGVEMVGGQSTLKKEKHGLLGKGAGKEYQTGRKIKAGNVFDTCNQRSTQQCMKSGFGKHLGVAVIHQQNGSVDETNVTLFAKDLIYYHSERDREQHSAWKLFSYREDNNETAFADERLRSGLPRVCWLKQREIYLVSRSSRIRVGHSTLSLKDSLSRDCDVEKNGPGGTSEMSSSKGLKVKEKLVHLMMVVKFKVLIEKKKMCSHGLMMFYLSMEFLMVHFEELEMKKFL
nr:glycoside hydrolase, family 9 [Tanacetum cinerariifolium]